MNELIDELSNTHCHYLRCIKPNQDKKSGLFNSQCVLEQLKYLGILDAVKLRKYRYSERMLHYEFFVRYEDIVDWDDKPKVADLKVDDENLPFLCEKVIKLIYPEYQNYQILFGKTLVFIKNNFYQFLDKIRQKYIDNKEHYVAMMAMKFRNMKYRKNFKKGRECVKILQRKFRKKLFFKKLLKIKNLILRIKRYLHTKKNKNWHLKISKSILIFKKFIKFLKLKIAYRKLILKIYLLKRNIMKFLNKLKRKKKKELKLIILDIINISWLKIVEIFFVPKIKKIQNELRHFKISKIFCKIKRRLSEILLNKKILAASKIQIRFRFMKFIRTFKILKKSSVIIQKFWKKNRLLMTIKILKSASILIQKNFRIFLERKSFLNKLSEEYFTKDNQLIEEYLVSNLRSLFPNYNYKAIKSNGPHIHTITKIRNLENYYEKKFLNFKSQLYFQASYLKLSPFDEPKLHFFAHILDIDLIINNSIIYKTLWSDTMMSLMKQNIHNNTPILKIDVGSEHTLAINSSGKCFTWGWNGNGECAIENQSFKREREIFSNIKAKKQKNFTLESLIDSIYVKSPIEIESFNFKYILAVENYSFGISKKEGKIYGFGSKNYLQFINRSSNYYKPKNILETNAELSKKKFQQITSSGKNTYALTDDGKVIILSYFAPNSETIKPPLFIYLNDIKVIQVECGKNFTILLTNSGILFSFGNNQYGQLGHSDYIDRINPEPIQKLKNDGVKITQISVGFKHVIAKSSVNKSYCWGIVNRTL